MGQRRTISSDMSDTFCNVLPLKVTLFVSMIHIIYTSILCEYLLPYFIIYDLTHNYPTHVAKPNEGNNNSGRNIMLYHVAMILPCWWHVVPVKTWPTCVSQFDFFYVKLKENLYFFSMSKFSRQFVF